MNYKETAKDIVKMVGGKENIKDGIHCMTRLRLELADETIPEDEEIKKIPGVIDVIRKGGQYQIIIGTEVPKVYEEFKEIVDNGGAAVQNTSLNEKEEASAKNKNPFIRTAEFISACMTPALPAIMAGGMVKVLLTILTTFGWIDTVGSTYQILSLVGDAPFYFLPFILAYTAAKKMETSIVMAMCVAGVMLHPNLIALFAEGSNIDFLGLPVTNTVYGSSVIPILIMIYFLKYIEIFADKVSPNMIKVFLKPLIIILIAAPLALIVVGPLGGFIGNGLAEVMQYLVFNVGWLAIMILAALNPLIVMTGMHYAMIPIGINALAILGYDLFAPVMFIANIAQGAAALAVSLRSKDKVMKQTAFSTSITALVAGITEPALYGVTLKLKYPLVAAMIGSATAGLFAGITTLYTYTAVGSSGIFTLLSMLSPDGNEMLIKGIVTMIISFGVTFVLTYILAGKKSDSIEH